MLTLTRILIKYSSFFFLFGGGELRVVRVNLLIIMLIGIKTITCL